MSLKPVLIILTFLSFLTVANNSVAQEEASTTLIRVTGTVVDSASNAPIRVNVFYEKLPYYDDMGTSSTNQNGVFELFMLDQTKYVINVKADGYKVISEELSIMDNGTQLVEKNFKMVPDAAHEKFNLHNLIFARGKAVIDPSSHVGLNEFVLWLNNRPEVSIRLEGHTDFQGNATANMQLSQDRVDAVKSYLTKKGVKKSRIGTKSYGGTQPLTRERTPEARTSNRRVEVTILKQ